MNLRDKTIIITGSTGGIGRELLKKIDSYGANLVLVSRSEEELSNQVRGLKSNSCYFVCDFSDQESVVKTAKEISKKYKSVDLLINMAGIGIYKPVEEIEVAEWNTALNVNLTSVFILIKELSKNLQKSKGSLVLNIGSGAGVIPMGGRSSYCSTKFALRGLTLSLAEEYKRTHVGFCLITLGSTLTSFGPKSLDDKKKDMDTGKAYFTPNWVAEKLISIILDDDRRVEYTLFPSNYLSEWQNSSEKGM